MQAHRPAERLTIYLSQNEHHGRVPTFVEVVDRARKAGLAGATVIQGTRGFGHPDPTDTARHHHAITIGEHVPVTVTIIDTPERISGFLSEIGPLLEHGRVVRRPTEVVISRGSVPDAEGGQQ